MAENQMTGAHNKFRGNFPGCSFPKNSWSKPEMLKKYWECVAWRETPSFKLNAESNKT